MGFPSGFPPKTFPAKTILHFDNMDAMLSDVCDIHDTPGRVNLDKIAPGGGLLVTDAFYLTMLFSIRSHFNLLQSLLMHQWVVPTDMEQKYSYEIRNALSKIFYHSQINIIITGVFLLLSAYLSLIVILNLNVVNPFTIMDDSTFSNTNINEYVWTTVSLFLLLVISLIGSKLAHLLRMPPLFGSLVFGIIIRNVWFLDELFFLNEYWELTVRRLSLCLIIIRWGIGIDTTYFLSNKFFPVFLGVTTVVCEAAVIALAGHFIFAVSLPMAVMLGFVLATVSGAVIGPVLVNLHNNNLGTEKRLPCLIATSAYFDTLCAVICLSMISSALFSHEAIFPSLLRVCVMALVCGIVGCIIGWLFWHFPKKDDPNNQMVRTMLLFFTCTPAVIGMTYLGSTFAGIFGSLCGCFVVSIRWRHDNNHGMYFVDRNFAMLWNILFCPILFILVGMKLHFSELSWTVVFSIFALIALGWVARLIAGLVCTSCQKFKLKEQLVICTAFLGRGTVQGALSPNLILLATPFPQYQEEATFVLVAAVLCILITAPLGRAIFSFTSKVLLSRNFVQTVQISPESPTSLDDFEEKTEKGLPDHSVITFKQFKALRDTQTDNLNERLEKEIYATEEKSANN